MQTANRVIKNTGFLYGKMGITMFISFLTTRLILNSLGTSDFGIFIIVGGSISMLGFLNAAMASATQRFMSFSEGQGDIDKQKTIFNISYVLHFGIAIFMGVILLIAGYFFFNGILNIDSERIFAAKVVYGSLIISTILTIMTVPYDAVVNAHENMLYFSIVGVFESLLKLGAALVVVNISGDKLVIYGILMAFIPVIIITIMRIYCHKKYTECVIAPKRYWDRTLMREMLGFAGWNLASTTVSMVSAYGNGILLNSFFGTILNAAMGIAGQINGQLQVLATNMLKALSPIMGKSAGSNNSDLLKKTTLIGAKYSTALFLLIALPVFIQAPYILKLWLKEIPDWTIVFVRFQLIKSFIEFQFNTIPGAIAATGRIKKYIIWNVTFNLLQLPFIYISFKSGFPPYYIYIITIIFGNIFVYAGALHFAKKYNIFKLSDYFKTVSLPIYTILFVVMGSLTVVSTIATINTFIVLLLFIIASLFYFVLIMYYIGCTKEERLLIIEIKNKFLNKKMHKL